MKTIHNLTVLGILAFLVISCQLSPNSPSEPIKGSGIIGTVFDKQGHKINGAKIKAVLVSSSLKKTSADFATSSDSTTTNPDGSFKIVLDPGSYDVQTDYGNGSLVSLNRNVTVQDSAPTELINVVKEPGKVHGSISLKVLQKKGFAKTEATDLSKGSCFIPRVSPVYRSDKDGVCEIPIVPEGNHDVVFEFPDYLASTESLYVESGKIVNTNVNLEYDPSNVPPTPVLKELIYDTLNGVMKIVWNKVLVSDLKGYVIYRANTVEANPTLYSIINQDTTFLDTVYKNPDPTSELPLDLLYLVKAQDSGLNLSAQYSNALKMSVNPPDYYKTKIAFTLNPKKISIGDSVWIKASCTNRLRKNDSIFWDVDGQKITKKMTGDLDSVLYISNTVKTANVKVSVKDDYGYTWTNQTSFDVKLYAPTLTVPKGFMVEAGKDFTLQANASDSVGKIVEYDWDLDGNGTFDTTTQGFSMTFNTNHDGKYIVRVKDDDGNIAIDSGTYSAYYPLIGNFTKDTILPKLSAPYLIMNDTILQGVTVNVAPGTKIYLQGSGGWGLTIKGNLNLIGTETDSITIQDISGKSGITYDENTSKGVKSTFRYVHFQDIAIWGLVIPNMKPIEVTHCFIDKTHIVAWEELTASLFVDPLNENRFVEKNVQSTNVTYTDKVTP